ncbi:transposable element Tcb1 transposase [Trichonephila clavipes]|nr:transposable element Tcb1 transposase [Trichonephila clavipes]
MIRWALKLSEFNIEWEHRPGVQNVVADLLSRNPVDSIEGSQISCAALRALAINSREQFIREQREDPELGHIYRYLENPDDGSVNATVCEGSSVPSPRQTDTISSDSQIETLYDKQGVSHGSIRSNQGQFKEHRKTSSKESEGCRSRQGTSRLPDCRLNKSTTVESRTEGSGRDNKTRQTRATTRGRNKQAERPVRSNQATTRRPCPYYLRSRVKESDGIPEEQRNIEINGIPHSRIRRSLSMEALDGDPTLMKQIKVTVNPVVMVTISVMVTRVLMTSKTHREEGLMHFKSIKARNPPFEVVWKIITYILKKNMQTTGNHQRARIVRHNDESVREGYIRNGGKEVKLFTSALKAFQCNNRIVMAQRKHLEDFLRGRIIGRLECGRTQLEVSEELGITESVISRLW